MIKKRRAAARRFAGVFKSRLHCVYALVLLSAVLFGTLGLCVNDVTVSADGEQVVKMKTMLSSPSEILRTVGVEYGERDKVTVSQPSFREMDIAVRYSFPVYITVGDNTVSVTTTGATVGELLDQAKIIVSDTDIVNYDLDTEINSTAYIDVVDIDYITETYVKRIYYQARTTYSADYPKGTRIVKEGSEGQKQITCKKTVVNGKVTEEQILSEVVLTEAVDRQVIIGTKKTASASKPSVIEKAPTESKPAAATTSASVSCVSKLVPPSAVELDKNGNPINYQKHLTVQATAYLAKGNCATGVKSRPGYIAVNPNFIPYGTKMYIKSSDGKYIYGYAVAADTGGFARNDPTKIDLSFATAAECSGFGRRNVEVYILE